MDGDSKKLQFSSSKRKKCYHVDESQDMDDGEAVENVGAQDEERLVADLGGNINNSLLRNFMQSNDNTEQFQEQTDEGRELMPSEASQLDDRGQGTSAVVCTVVEEETEYIQKKMAACCVQCMAAGVPTECDGHNPCSRCIQESTSGCQYERCTIDNLFDFDGAMSSQAEEPNPKKRRDPYNRYPCFVCRKRKRKCNGVIPGCLKSTRDVTDYIRGLLNKTVQLKNEPLISIYTNYISPFMGLASSTTIGDGLGMGESKFVCQLTLNSILMAALSISGGSSSPQLANKVIQYVSTLIVETEGKGLSSTEVFGLYITSMFAVAHHLDFSLQVNVVVLAGLQNIPSSIEKERIEAISWLFSIWFDKKTTVSQKMQSFDMLGPRHPPWLSLIREYMGLAGTSVTQNDNQLRAWAFAASSVLRCLILSSLPLNLMKIENAYSTILKRILDDKKSSVFRSQSIGNPSFLPLYSCSINEVTQFALKTRADEFRLRDQDTIMDLIEIFHIFSEIMKIPNRHPEGPAERNSYKVSLDFARTIVLAAKAVSLSISHLSTVSTMKAAVRDCLGAYPQLPSSIWRTNEHGEPGGAGGEGPSSGQDADTSKRATLVNSLSLAIPALLAAICRYWCLQEELEEVSQLIENSATSNDIRWSALNSLIVDLRKEIMAESYPAAGASRQLSSQVYRSIMHNDLGGDNIAQNIPTHGAQGRQDAIVNQEDTGALPESIPLRMPTDLNTDTQNQLHQLPRDIVGNLSRYDTKEEEDENPETGPST